MTDDRPERSRAILRAGIGAAGVTGGLLAAAAAIGEPADRGRVVLPARWLGEAVLLSVDALTGAVLAAGALLAVAVVWALATARRRGVLEKRPWWHTPLAVTLLAAVTLVFAWQLEQGWLGERVAELIAEQPLGADPDAEPLPELGRIGPGEAVDPALRRTAAVAGALLVAAAVAAWWLWPRRGGAAETAPVDTGPVAARLAEAVDAALEDLDAEADVRRAVLRCYAHLEAALLAAGCARRPAETAREHRLRAAGTLGPAAEAAARLVERFERARYHRAPVSEADRREATAALRDVRAALDERAADDRSRQDERLPSATSAAGRQG